MVVPRVRDLGKRRLRAIGNAKSGFLDHQAVVCAVANRQGDGEKWILYGFAVVRQHGHRDHSLEHQTRPRRTQLSSGARRQQLAQLDQSAADGHPGGVG